jgi:hypothetical protein
MARVLRHDGWLPYWLPKQKGLARPDAPEQLAMARDWIGERRSLDGFDIVVEGTTPADDPRAAARKVQQWADAGATWWIESDWSSWDPEAMRRRIEAGPPAALVAGTRRAD